MCFEGERRLGVRLRRALGLMGRDEGKIATLFRLTLLIHVLIVTRFYCPTVPLFMFPFPVTIFSALVRR